MLQLLQVYLCLTLQQVQASSSGSPQQVGTYIARRKEIRTYFGPCMGWDTIRHQWFRLLCPVVGLAFTTVLNIPGDILSDIGPVDVFSSSHLHLFYTEVCSMQSSKSILSEAGWNYDTWTINQNTIVTCKGGTNGVKWFQVCRQIISTVRPSSQGVVHYLFQCCIVGSFLSNSVQIVQCNLCLNVMHLHIQTWNWLAHLGIRFMFWVVTEVIRQKHGLTLVVGDCTIIQFHSEQEALQSWKCEVHILLKDFYQWFVISDHFSFVSTCVAVKFLQAMENS